MRIVAGSARPGRFSSRNASWNGRHAGLVDVEPLRQRARRPRGWRRGTHRARRASLASIAIPRSIRSAATPASRSSSSAVSRRRVRADRIASRCARDPGAVLTDERRERGLRPRRRRRARRARPSRAPRPSIVRGHRLFDLGASGSSACAADGTRRRRAPSRPRRRGRSRTRGCRRSGGPRPGRPSPRHRRRAGRAAGRTAARSAPRALAGTRRRGRAASASGSAIVDEEDRDRARARRDLPIEPVAGTGRSSTCSSSPPESGTDCADRRSCRPSGTSSAARADSLPDARVRLPSLAVRPRLPSG